MCCFCFNDAATTEIYTYLHTLSLHDALPICQTHQKPRAERCSTTRQAFTGLRPATLQSKAFTGLRPARPFSRRKRTQNALRRAHVGAAPAEIGRAHV